MLQNVKTLIAIEGLLIIGMLLFRLALRPGNRQIVDIRAVLVTLSVPAVALLAHNVFIYYAFLAAAVAFNARSRAELGATYLLMLPMTPLLPLETAAGGVYLLPLSAVAAMNLGALIGLAITPGRRTFASGAADIAALLLITLFTYIDGRDVSAISIARSVGLFVVAYAGPYLLVSRSITNRDQLDRALLRLALAALMAAVIAMFETRRHWVLYQSFNDALHVPISLQSATLGMRGGRLRTGGPLVDFSVAGVFFSAAIVMLPYLKSRFRPGWFWVIAGATLGGLFVTQSRGAWIGVAVGFAAILVYRGYLWRAVALGSAAVLLRFALVASLGKGSRLAETLGKSGQAADTVEYRHKLLTQGFRQVLAHPLTGQPPKQLVAHLPDLVQGQHIVDFVNAHLYIAMAAGVPWFVVWAAIWALPMVRAWRVRRSAAPGPNPAEVPFGIVVATMVTIAATSIVDRNVTWPTIALALIGPCVALARTRGSRQAAPRPRRALVSGLPVTDSDSSLIEGRQLSY